MSFAGKVALVTGAAGNLGRAVAGAFAAAGAQVALVDHAKGDGGADDAQRFGVVADLRDEASTRAAVDAVFARFGRIDVLCNIAGGFAAGAPVHETSGDLWRRMFQLNVMSIVHTAKAVVPRMIAAGRGNIVNVGAAGSQRGLAGMAAYAVAKNGVARLTESMAAELRDHGICVTCVMPTTLDTPQNRAAMPGADAGLWTPPEALAELVLFLASDAALLVTGQSLVAAGRPASRAAPA